MRPTQNPAENQQNNSEPKPFQLKADFYVASSDSSQLNAEKIRQENDIKSILNQAENLNELCLSWLQTLAKNLEVFDQGIILLKSEDKLVPVAVWPTSQLDLSNLTFLAKSALTQQKSLEVRAFGKPGEVGRINLAMLIEIETTVYGAVAMSLATDNPQFVKHANLMMSWGMAWLTQFLWRDGYQQSTATSERLSLITDLMLLVAEKKEFQETLLTLVNDLATRLQLKRVSLGWIEHDKLQVKAISHASHFQQSHAAIQCLSRAMEEAHDQSSNIVLPYSESIAGPKQNRLITSDHQQLLVSDAVEAVASFLLQLPGRIVGVLTFEYAPDRKLGRDDIVLGDFLGLALAPLLSEKRQSDRWLGAKFTTKLQKLKRALLGEEHPVYKLATAGLVLSIAILFLVQADFRITAKTVIEGLIQRAAVAPFDGFIDYASVRAGDHVKSGQILVGLQDKDLLLEKTRLKSEAAQSFRKYRDALAKHDRAGASVANAQLEQAEAQLALVMEKIERASIKSPFDGIVVSGDLSQKLGSPVEQGSVLFEITPLDAYRIILKVDERDIIYVQPGQSGLLTLTGLTAEKLPFTVKKVTPLAVAEEGMNYFRVEANLEGEKLSLRPGMEGVGKITVGKESLWRIWTRRFLDWLSLSMWKWLP